MATYESLRQAIDTLIKTNGNEEITGAILNNVLNAMITALGANYQFCGEAKPSTNPGQPLQNVFYFAYDAGTYVNFGNITLPMGISTLSWDGTSWTGETIYQIDSTPLLNSTKLITSGGVFNALSQVVAGSHSGKIYAGIATPSTQPQGIVNEQPIFYIATQAGTYSHFLVNYDIPLVIPNNGIWILTSGADDDDWNAQDVIGLDSTPTSGSHNLVESGGVFNELALGAVYDVSAKNPTAGPNNDGKFASLSALLNDANLNTLIPVAFRKGGMSIKFLHTSDNKYVQYRYKGTATTGNPNPFLDTANWEKMDIEAVRSIVGDFKDFDLGTATKGYYNSDGTIGVDNSWNCKEVDVTALVGEIVAYRLGFQIPERQYNASAYCFLKKSDDSIVALNTYKINTDDTIILIKIPSDASKLLISWAVDIRYTTNPFVSYYYTGNFLYKNEASIRSQEDVRILLESIGLGICKEIDVTNYTVIDDSYIKTSGVIETLSNYGLSVVEVQIKSGETLFVRGESGAANGIVFTYNSSLEKYEPITSFLKISESLHDFYLFFKKFDSDTTIFINRWITNYNKTSIAIGGFAYSNTTPTIFQQIDALSNLPTQVLNLEDKVEGCQQMLFSAFTWTDNYWDLSTGELKSGGVTWACTNKVIKQLNVDKSLVSTRSFISYWNGETYLGYYQDGKYYNTSGTEISEITDFTKYALNIRKGDLPDYESIDFTTNTLPDVDKRLTTLENAATKNFWTNKKLGFLGDSITEGAYFDAQGGHYTDRPYPLIVGEILGATAINYGDSGTSISGTSTIDPSNSFTHRYSSMANDLDMVVVLGGTNDFSNNNGVILGTSADTTDISFYGAMDVLCRGLLTKYPPKRIVFITPLLRDSLNSGKEGTPNDRGFTLEQVRQAIIDVAQNRYGLYVINGKCLGLSPFSPNRESYIYDGLHPNPLGYEMLGRNIAHILSAI